MSEEEQLENTRRLFANADIRGKPKTTWYRSVTDPEGNVLVNFDTGQIKIRDKKLWEAFVSNTWIQGSK
jgi:hypothetical protein